MMVWGLQGQYLGNIQQQKKKKKELTYASNNYRWGPHTSKIGPTQMDCMGFFDLLNTAFSFLLPLLTALFCGNVYIL